MDMMDIREKYTTSNEMATVSVPANSTSDIDLTINKLKWLSGVKLVLNGHNWNDNLVIEVVDSTLGVVNTLSNGYPIAIDKQDQGKESDYWAKIPQGLTLRLKYTNSGSNDVDVKAYYYMHEEK